MNRPNFSPLAPCRVPLSFAEGSQMYRDSYGPRHQAFRSLAPTTAGCSCLSLVCAMTAVSSPAASPPSRAPLPPCLDSPPAPANGETHKPSPKPAFWSQRSAPRPPLLPSHKPTDCRAYLIRGQTHSPSFGTMCKCFPWWLVVYQKASYNSGVCHNIINPSWSATWNGVGYGTVSKY